MWPWLTSTEAVICLDVQGPGTGPGTRDLETAEHARLVGTCLEKQRKTGQPSWPRNTSTLPGEQPPDLGHHWEKYGLDVSQSPYLQQLPPSPTMMHFRDGAFGR